MNYLLEINLFYNFVQMKQLSTGQIALWHALMNINNKCAWIEWFNVSNQMLKLITGLSRTGIQKARNTLKQYGLIDFKSNGTKATKYHLIPIAKSVQIGNQDSGSSNGQIGGILNKTNKNKLDNKEDNKKKFGEYGNVLLDAEQYQKLIIEFPRDYQSRIQRLDDYIQSSGRKYNDHLATIRNWAKKEGYKKTGKIEYKTISADELTCEEYTKLIRGDRDV